MQKKGRLNRSRTRRWPPPSAHTNTFGATQTSRHLLLVAAASATRPPRLSHRAVGAQVWAAEFAGWAGDTLGGVELHGPVLRGAPGPSLVESVARIARRSALASHVARPSSHLTQIWCIGDVSSRPGRHRHGKTPSSDVDPAWHAVPRHAGQARLAVLPTHPSEHSAEQLAQPAAAQPWSQGPFDEPAASHGMPSRH